MSHIVIRTAPKFKLRKEVKVDLPCPTCNQKITVDADDVDKGNIVQCSNCDGKTYYPFDRPWYRNTKIVIGFILSLIVAIVVGVLGDLIFGAVFSQ